MNITAKFVNVSMMIATWATLFVALLIVWLQNRSNRKTMGLQLYNQLAAQWDSNEMQNRRSRLALRLLRKPERIDIEDSILVFFENIGHLTRKGLLDKELIWNTYSIDIAHYWLACQAYVLHTRSQFKCEEMYKEFESLNRLMQDVTAEVTGSSASLQISPSSVQHFLKLESRRGTND